MSAPRDQDGLLAERIGLVLALGEANAAHHRAQAGAGGAEITVMMVEERLAADPGPAQRAALYDARAADAAAQTRLEAAAARVRVLEERLAALDGDLAATVSAR